MQLDFIDNINEFGDNIVRLYDFDKSQAELFRQLIQDIILTQKEILDLGAVEFIQPRNCNLIFRISDTDEGIRTIDYKLFICDLTLEGFENMVTLLKPFCLKETKGYQWLYDIDSPTDFLFSPGGTW